MRRMLAATDSSSVDFHRPLITDVIMLQMVFDCVACIGEKSHWLDRTDFHL
jgi:hypothetical protein